MNANEMSAAALAYLGDSVIELLVREKLVNDGFSDSGNLNRESLKYVNLEKITTFSPHALAYCLSLPSLTLGKELQAVGFAAFEVRKSLRLD